MLVGSVEGGIHVPDRITELIRRLRQDKRKEVLHFLFIAHDRGGKAVRMIGEDRIWVWHLSMTSYRPRIINCVPLK
jgi:hypothetical protein